MDKQLSNYLSNLIPAEKEWVKDLQNQAKSQRIPIMDSIGMQFVMQLIRLNKPKRILEIGTAIGYSALRMLEANPECSIVTIERDLKRYEQAVANTRQFDVERKIKLIYGDALTVMEQELTNIEPFDCVLIDATKGQYKNYFLLADSLLVNHGFIIADNVLFRGYVADMQGELPPRYKNLIKRLRAFNQWISSQETYDTSIIPIGDGIAVSYKKSEGALINEE